MENIDTTLSWPRDFLVDLWKAQVIYAKWGWPYQLALTSAFIETWECYQFEDSPEVACP